MSSRVPALAAKHQSPAEMAEFLPHLVSYCFWEGHASLETFGQVNPGQDIGENW